MSVERGSDVPEVLLEQYRLGELTGSEAARIERRLREDEHLRQRLEALERSDRDLSARYPGDWLARRAQDRIDAGARAGRQPRRGPGVVAVASTFAGIAVAIALAVSWTRGAAVIGDDRIKGLAPALTVYRRTVEGSETLADGAPARQGDLLRLGYISAGRQYGVILSIDGRGVVTRHLPPDGSRAAALRAGTDGPVLLDSAYELDDAPAWERFYFVTSDQPFDVAAVEEAARRAAGRHLQSPPDALPIPRDLEQSTFTLQKEVRP